MDLKAYLAPHGIDLCGVLPLSACRVRKPYLLRAQGLTEQKQDGAFVQLFAIPYYSPAADAPDRNISAYAVVEDYHVFIKELSDALLAHLRHDFPQHIFAAFADHSPIDEISAAVDAGLGVRGKNGLLLTERYSSYVFLAEIITDLPLTPTPTQLPPELRVCHGCDLCMRACPMQRKGGICRSALTQKKAPLTEDEQTTLRSFDCLWGCDICQEVCPYTARARRLGTLYSPIPFFRRNTLSHLTLDALDAMDDQAFSRRAYAWRGREVIRRNLLLHQSIKGETDIE